MMHLDNQKQDIKNQVLWALEKDKTRIDSAKNSITGLSPFKLFEKGYALGRGNIRARV